MDENTKSKIGKNCCRFINEEELRIGIMVQNHKGQKRQFHQLMKRSERTDHQFTITYSTSSSIEKLPENCDVILVSYSYIKHGLLIKGVAQLHARIFKIS